MKKKEKLNVFICKIRRIESGMYTTTTYSTPQADHTPILSLDFVAVGYNRGHAAKQIAKQLEARGLKLEKSDPIEQLNLEEAQAICLS